jgi:esterase/lipase superfamily enzyme
VVADTSSDPQAWAGRHTLVVQALQDTHKAETLRITIKDIVLRAPAEHLDIFQDIVAQTEDQAYV